MRPKIFHN